MKTITVYDPPLCCDSGVCGPAVDPVLPWFAGILARLAERGVEVRRYNLARQPLEFLRNAELQRLLETEGSACLPAIFVDGALVRRGAYPDEELAGSWFAAPVGDARS